MDFYNDLSVYYDRLFPRDPGIVTFLEKRLSHAGPVLDLACGTGTYAAALARLGFRVVGIDMDRGMIRTAEENLLEEKPEVRARVRFISGDMERLTDLVEHRFAGAYCIGNSIVHLPSRERIRSFLETVFHALDPGGVLLVQTINFDRILDEGLSGLPTLEGRGVRMERRYEASPDGARLVFRTKLVVGEPPEEVRTVENTVPLIPLRRDELLMLIRDAGFSVTEISGSYNGSPHEPGSFLTIVYSTRSGTAIGQRT